MREYCVKRLSPYASQVHKKIGEVNVCQICLTKYPSETMLIIHMWQRHVNCEAPYRCELCDYRTSFHYDSVDHFFKVRTIKTKIQLKLQFICSILYFIHDIGTRWI